MLLAKTGEVGGAVRLGGGGSLDAQSLHGAAELKAEPTGHDFGLQWRENTFIFV